jgi:HSP20 family protein
MATQPDAQPQKNQQTKDRQSGQQQQQQTDDRPFATDPRATRSAGTSRDSARAIATTSEVPARRAAASNRTRLVTPFELMRRMSAELDRVVDALDGRQRRDNAAARTNRSQDVAGESRDGELARADWIPRIEVAQRDGAMVVRAELAGLKPDDIVVNVANGVLTISGERRKEQNEEHDGVVRTERVYGSFFRSIPLPDGANEEQVTATFRDGMLELTIPLTEPEQGRRVEVQS